MEKNTVLISVIIPMFNAEATILRTIISVIKQTYRCDYEIIVINDGSVDNSQKLVEKYKHDNPSLNLILINQSNGGVSKARNHGLKISKGDFIAFLDSDDFWLDTKIEKQVRYFEKGFDFIGALRNSEKITFPYQLNYNYAEITLKKLLFKVVAQTSTVILSRKALNNSGFFDENQRYSEDANYWMKISRNNKMIILNEVLVQTDNDYGQMGLSSNLKSMELGVKKNIKEMYDLREINFWEYHFFNLFSHLKYLRRLYR